MRRLLLTTVLLAGCTRVGTGQESPAGEPAPTPTTVGVAPIPAPPPVTVTKPAPKPTQVELTAVTLADDCGGTPPARAPSPVTKTATKLDVSEDEGRELKAKSERAAGAGARAARRCEQTSMQLSIAAGDASSIQVKSVELFDDTGKSLGTLTASTPTRWSDANGVYEAWDQRVAASSTNSVSYVLSQPAWNHVGNRWNRTYTLKTVVSVGGVDQAAQKAVTLSLPASLPPNVRT
jgi:hypothetical protein